MPLYMDRHDVEGAKPEDVYGAHLLDLEVQEKYGVKYLTYWMDPERGNIFCLVDAPSTDAAMAVHKEAHGLIGNEIIPVDQGTVSDFLGRLTDPEGTSTAQPISDSAFRTILFTDIEGSTALTQKLGDDAAMAFVRSHNDIVRAALKGHEGSEVKHTGDGIMASFASVTRAIDSSLSIQREFHRHNSTRPDEVVRVRVGLSAGEPVQESGDFFGAVVQLARRICDAADPSTILTSNAVRELCLGKSFNFSDRGEMTLKGFDAPVRVHEVGWGD
jgi:class 3 adenylate cyclase